MTVIGDRPEIDPDAPRAATTAAPWFTAPLAGLVAATAAVAVAAALAALADVISPTDAVGSEFIDHTPAWLKNWAIDTFGTNDKVALKWGIFLTIGLLALGFGALGRRHPLVAAGGIAAFGIGGAFVVAGRPDGSVGAAVPVLVGTGVGCALVGVLLGRIRRGDGARAYPKRSAAPEGWDRRRFVVTTGGAVAVSAIGALVARREESGRITAIGEAAPSTLPPLDPRFDPPTVPAGADLVPGTPFVTPNADFYRIDTALSFPRIDLDRWSVSIGGLVDRPITLSYADLLARPQVQRMVTLTCVSNEVGGDLIGNAVWQGVLLADLVREAGPQAAAEQVFSTSLDGWTCGFPLADALDGRDALIAIGMNGEALPLRHGFPARLVVPGLYGYVSATKWLSKIELTRWDGTDGYWVPLGWSKLGPIKTHSRIDVPRAGARVDAGRVAVAGVAWAPNRGVERVEVRVDKGEWMPARLGAVSTDDSWRQWVFDWDATPGSHSLQVRATDGTGVPQTEELARPDPDGATGFHTRRIEVR